MTSATAAYPDRAIPDDETPQSLSVNPELDDPAPRRLSDDELADHALALIGDVSAGRRAIELGLASNLSIRLAGLGAKAIAVDPDPEQLAHLRLAAADADVSVECHTGDLADLGFAPSGTIDVVVSLHTLDLVDDLGRILRQVHRVLRPGAPFVCVLDHPFAWVGPAGDSDNLRRYGDARRTVGELLAAFDRSNFRVEVFDELVPDDGLVPDTLTVKLRKQGS